MIMDYSQFEKYEYKAPSYALLNRIPSVNHQEHAEKRRFFYDAQGNRFCSTASAKDSISMLFCGDLLCQERMLTQYQTKDGGYDFSPCFTYIKPLLHSADFVVGNLETSISHTAPYRGEILTHEGPYYCNAPLEYLAALSDAGFDMLTTENNHTLDAGVRGLVETIENIKNFGLLQTGTFVKEEDKFLIVDICGFKVGFTAFGTGDYNTMQTNLTQEGMDTLLNTYSPARAEAICRTMREKGAEYLICFPHWGTEYTDVLTPKQTAIAAELTAIGFDMVLGSHSHVIQKQCTLNGKPVVYSMGNLISHLNTTRKDVSPTVLCHVRLERKNNIIHSTLEFIPCKILRRYNRIPYCVVPVSHTLGLTEALIPSFKNISKFVASRLKCPPEQVVTDFPLESAQIERFLLEKSELSEKLSTLSHVKKKTPRPKAITVPRKHFWHSFTGYHEENNALYKLFPFYCELILVTRTSEVLTLPTEVDCLPVEVVRSGCKNHTARIVYLGKFVKVLKDGAFRQFTRMESIRMYNQLKVIGKEAFSGCSSMTGIVIPGSVEKIGSRAFSGCSKLLSVKIPPSVTKLGADIFKGCPNLTIYCTEGSAADHYAQANRIPVKYMPLETILLPSVSRAKRSKKTVFPSRKATHSVDTYPVMGPLNGPNDKHPASIIATCYQLNQPLPRSAICQHQPSYYIGADTFDGTLETICRLLGNNLPLIPYEELERLYELFNKKYLSQKILSYTTTDLTVYFCDWILFAKDRGFSLNCYFDYELYNKEPAVRDTFLNEGYRQRVYEACNTTGFRSVYLDKAKFNAKFKKYVTRDWIDASECTFEEFRKFAEKHEKFFGKPVRGTGGEGARVIHRNSDTLENLFEMCQSEGLIVEEVINQHPSLAEFNQSTLNTVRINTLLCADNEVRILLTVARFGRAGNAVDNFHGGGVGAIVDIDTGIIITEAINQAHERTPIHPDSKKMILGFQYPEWEKVKKAVCDAALMTPMVRQVGWDVSVTASGNIEFVEGNSRPNFDVLQSPDQLGRRFRYAPYIPEIERLTGIQYPELPPLVIDITGMETD